MEKPGIFIVVEGCDATGKTTVVKRLESMFERLNLPVLSTREPGGTPISEKIRDILLDRANSNMRMKTEALLYAASRAQIVDEVIRPALSLGKTVICQRYLYSSIAYQAVAGGLGCFVKRLNDWAASGLYPDLVILLDMDPSQSLARRPEGHDRIELRSDEYHSMVRNAFLEMASKEPDRFFVIDAASPLEVVQQEAERAVLEFLMKRDNTE